MFNGSAYLEVSAKATIAVCYSVRSESGLMVTFLVLLFRDLLDSLSASACHTARSG